MASIIANYASAAGQPIAFTPANRITLADQTATSSVQTLAVAATFFRVLIVFKTYVLGNDSTGPVFDFNVSDTVAGTVNVQTLVSATAKLVVSGTQIQVFFWDVLVAPVVAKGFWKIVVTFQGTGTGAYDAQVDAV